MEEDVEVRDRLLKALRNIKPSKIGSGGNEIIVTCPRCGHLHLAAGPHFYIEANGPMRVNCFHCPLDGVLTPSILHEIGIENLEFDEFLNKLHKQDLKKVKINQDGSRVYKIPTNYTEEDLKKIRYSKERTGIDFENPEIIKSYKLIYNLKQFLKVNNLVLQQSELLINELSNHAIGFLSYNNNTINLRNVSSNRLERYTNLKIDKTIQSPFLYIPPCEIDVLTESPMIVLAEGAYDILCIKERFYPKDSTNIIFGAAGSKGSFKSAITKLIGMTCYFGADITIFSDTDASIEAYQKTFKNNFMKCNKFKIIYNTLNKDFGDIRESFKFKTYKLK